MLSRRRSLPSLLALLILVAPLGAVPAAHATPTVPSADETPRLAVLWSALWNQTIGWWPSVGVITAADGEEPPPDEEPPPEEEDPFGGSGEPDPGSGGGVTDPNGG